MKNRLFLTAMAFFLFACASSKYPETGYEGTWMLKRQSGGFAGKTTLPEKESLLVIGAGTMTKYEDGTLISKDSFKLEKAKVIQSPELQDVVVSDRIRKQSLEVKGDTLIVTDQCYDCYQYLYVKKK